MSKSKFDKDIELVKVSMVAEEWRGSFLMQIGTLLTAFVALSAVLLGAEYANQISPIVTISGISVIGVVLYVASHRYFVAPYRKRGERLDKLLEKISGGQSIGEVSDLLKEKF